MRDEEAIERMLNQLADIFKMVDSNRDKALEERVSPEIKKKLAEAKELIDKFNELNLKVFRGSGLSEEKLEEIIEHSSSGLSEKQKKILEFSKKLKSDIETARRSLRAHEEGTPLQDIKQDPKKAKAVAAKRKKKFKRMGGDSWLPL